MVRKNKFLSFVGYSIILYLICLRWIIFLNYRIIIVNLSKGWNLNVSKLMEKRSKKIVPPVLSIKFLFDIQKWRFLLLFVSRTVVHTFRTRKYFTFWPFDLDDSHHEFHDCHSWFKSFNSEIKNYCDAKIVLFSLLLKTLEFFLL